MGKYLEIAQAVATRRRREGSFREEDRLHSSVAADTETAMWRVPSDTALADLQPPRGLASRKNWPLGRALPAVWGHLAMAYDSGHLGL
jgi:hypothetical protein